MPTAFPGAADHSARIVRRLGVAAVLMVVLGACTEDGPAGSPRPTPDDLSRVVGTVLVTQRFGCEIATIALPDGEPQPLVMPEDVRFVHAAYLVEDGGRI